MLRYAEPLLRKDEKIRQRIYYRRQKAEQKGRDQGPDYPFADFIHIVTPPSLSSKILYAKNYFIGRIYVLLRRSASAQYHISFRQEKR